jgi:hypothetical protein
VRFDSLGYVQGFCRYLEKQFSDLKQRGVVISFDARAHPASGGSSRRYLGLRGALGWNLETVFSGKDFFS